MIDPKEIRIGNLVQKKTDASFIVNGICHNWEAMDYLIYAKDDISYLVEELYPITITPEWLERLGFEKREYHNGYTDYLIEVPNDYGGYIIGGTYNDKFRIRLEGCDEGRVGIYIDYIHQLQNLYHSLTGQELEVKEMVK